MGIVLVYDCTEETTFNNITNWLKQIEQHATDDVMKVLIANKIDLPNRVIETERGEQLAKEYGLAFFETSARTGVNINELFHNMAQSIMKDKPHLTSTNQGSSGNTGVQICPEPPRRSRADQPAAGHSESRRSNSRGRRRCSSPGRARG